MPTWLSIALLALLALVVLLSLGGAVAGARRRRAAEAAFHSRVEQANRALADAHAQDKGWERGALEAAARAAFAERHAGAEIRELVLVQVVDRPGTDEDLAVFRVVDAEGREAALTLGRRDGVWAPA